MTGKLIKGKISITRPSYGDEREKISIQIKDDLSKIQFLTVEIDYADFAQCITGLSFINCDLYIHRMGLVGKNKIVESRTCESPGNMSKDELEKWLKENKQEEGWILNSYLGSKGSCYFYNGKQYLRYSVCKYIDECCN